MLKRPDNSGADPYSFKARALAVTQPLMLGIAVENVPKRKIVRRASAIGATSTANWGCSKRTPSEVESAL